MSLALIVSAAAYPQGTMPTIADARAFLDKAEGQLLELSNEASRAQWVQATYITHDTELLAADASQKLIAAMVEYAKEAKRFDGVKLPEDMERKMLLLKVALVLPAPANQKESEELTRIVTGMESTYGLGKYCPTPAPKIGDDNTDGCWDIEEMTELLAKHFDPKLLKEVWTGWRTISPPMRKDFQRYVELANKGARELGFKNTGELWRSKYDMSPEEFAREVDRLWEQVRPLYVSLHAYVRNKLLEKYGPEVVPAKGPIPAHLLGNMWAQSWENLYPILAPAESSPAYSLDEILRQRKVDAKEMTKIGERFFTSLGFKPLPDTFWERSLFVKPRDREVVCHASAWNLDNEDDLRIKMCIDPTEEDFITIHHELGHNFYQRAYNTKPFLFRDSANDGFHEAIGDTIALSITPEYLKQIGLIDTVPDPSKDIGLLLRQALEKVAFLPFGLLIDQWRWKVFSGEVTPENYNRSWWELRQKYQGVAAPVERTEQHFDPGAKYHVPSNVPYTRYFLAHILQFQFHRSLAQAAGCQGPLHRCSIYGSEEAGARLRKMLELGLSQPWQVALKSMTGVDKMDATAIRDYFAPLQKWLDEQNKGKPVGW
jgi:peptidyl-dipeptidase A